MITRPYFAGQTAIQTVSRPIRYRETFRTVWCTRPEGDLKTKGTYVQRNIQPLGVVVVKELHDVQQEEEGVAEVMAGGVAVGPVPNDRMTLTM